MGRKRATWMIDATEQAAQAVVFAVLPWRADGLYRRGQAVKTYQRRHHAEAFATRDTTGTLVVRTFDAV